MPERLTSLRGGGALAALLCLLALPARAEQPLPVYPGTVHTRIGNDLAIGGRYFRMAYFVTSDPMEQVALHFARKFHEDGYPTFSDGDLQEEGVVSAFMTREGLVKSVVLRRHGGKTLGFSVLKDLWVDAPKGHGLANLPKLEGALFHDELSHVDRDGRAGQRTQVLPGTVDAVRAELLARMGREGFKLSREGALKSEGGHRLVIEQSRAGEQVVTVLAPVEGGMVAVHQTWVGSDRVDAVPNDRALEDRRRRLGEPKPRPEGKK